MRLVVDAVARILITEVLNKLDRASQEALNKEGQNGNNKKHQKQKRYSSIFA